MWLRLYPETVWDRKLRRHPAAYRWAWIVILCLASESPERGRLLLGDGLPLTAEDLADAACIPVEDARGAIGTFLEQGMLLEDDGALVVTRWSERQYETTSADRTRRWREKRKRDVTVTSQKRHGDVTGDASVTHQITEYREQRLTPNGVSSGEPIPVPERERPGNKIPPCPHKKIVEAWNEIMPPLGIPAVRDLTENRKRGMTREWAKQRENLKSLEDFRAFFSYLASDCSKALTRGNWFSFDWLFERPENFSKALEGNYDNRRGSS